MTTSASSKGSIAYLTAIYPGLSETFVYREVLGLRARGWQVLTASLHPILDHAKQAQDVGPAEIVLYGRHLPATLLGATVEFVAHPIRSLLTMLTSVVDAIAPREPTGILSRVRGVGLALMSLALARVLRSRATRHIHCHFANGPTTIGMYAARQLGIGFSFTGHANDLFDRRSLLVLKLKRAAFVSSISRWHQEWYAQISGISADHFPVIRCGVDVTRWKPAEPRVSSRGTLDVVVVARLVRKKGVDTLIRALALAKREHALAWNLTIAGDGPQRFELEQLASELGFKGTVTFLGAVGNQVVREVLGRADVFALPCRTDHLGDRDGIPVVLMAAMAMEVPVVAGSLPTIRDLIRDGSSGILVPPDDEPALALVLSRLARDPDYRRDLGAGGRKTVLEEFSLEQNLSRIESEIARVLSAAPSAGVAPGS